MSVVRNIMNYKLKLALEKLEQNPEIKAEVSGFQHVTNALIDAVERSND